jgi:hypothetical protein
MAVLPASAQDIIGARGFVAGLYINKTNSRSFSYASQRVLTADLYGLVQNASATPDYDPLCSCTNNDGLSAQILSVTGNDKQAVAQVLLRFDADRAAPSQRLTLVLTRASLAGWKIADIKSTRMPSLRAWFVRHQRRAPGSGIARVR